MDPLGVVRASVGAVGLAQRAHPDVRLTTPRGPLVGHDGVRTFAQRQTYGARMQVENVRAVDAGDATFTEDVIELRSVDDGPPMGRETARERRVGREGAIVELAPHDGALPG